jgi:hypothetical protein
MKRSMRAMSPDHLHIERERERHAQRERGREGGRERERDRERDRDREREREREGGRERERERERERNTETHAKQATECSDDQLCCTTHRHTDTQQRVVGDGGRSLTRGTAARR